MKKQLLVAVLSLSIIATMSLNPLLVLAENNNIDATIDDASMDDTVDSNDVAAINTTDDVTDVQSEQTDASEEQTDISSESTETPIESNEESSEESIEQPSTEQPEVSDTQTDVQPETDVPVEESTEVETENIQEAPLYATMNYIVYLDGTGVSFDDYVSTTNTFEVGTTECLSFQTSHDYLISGMSINGVSVEYTDYAETESAFIFTYSDIAVSEVMNVEINLTPYRAVEESQVVAIAESADSFKASLAGCDISIDGHFDDWNNKPISYHYNWDNSENCWNHGEWADGQCYKTERGTYDNNVRHGIQMYEENGYVFVHIKIATIYQSGFNGEDYQLTFNGSNVAKFQITDNNGRSLTNNVNSMAPGTYNVQVRHGAGSCSYEIAEASSAVMKIYSNHKNTEIEFAIPMYECKRQNANIDLENAESITFFTPNLMYTRIESHGTPTSPIPLVGVCAGLALGGTVYASKKKGKNGTAK